jgi:hypothetical protein
MGDGRRPLQVGAENKPPAASEKPNISECWGCAATVRPTLISPCTFDIDYEYI